MSRNKYPEQTVRRILDTATRLFLKNGYEKTSMQAIVQELGMSKGAIYHHFHSKEELFEQVVMDYYASDDWYEEIARDETKNALEKMQAMFLYQMENEEKLAMDQLYFMQISDSRVLVEHMRVNMTESAPMIAVLIEEGNRDGSCHVEQPLETSELMLLIVNVWIGMFTSGREKFIAQLRLARFVLEGLGLPLIDKRLEAAALNYFDCAFDIRTGKCLSDFPRVVKG